MGQKSCACHLNVVACTYLHVRFYHWSGKGENAGLLYLLCFNRRAATFSRTQTVKGGMEVSYRALVVVGNLNGVGGFAMGKANNPADAVIEASRYVSVMKLVTANSWCLWFFFAELGKTNKQTGYVSALLIFAGGGEEIATCHMPHFAIWRIPQRLDMFVESNWLMPCLPRSKAKLPRNLVYVQRYKQACLYIDVLGKHNGCKVKRLGG